MDKYSAHDVVHQYNGGMASNCPFCEGKMSEPEMMAEAKRIAVENYKPRVKPNLEPDKRLIQYAELSDPAKETAKVNEPDDDKKMFEFRPLVDLLSFSEDTAGLPRKIKLIPVGEYNMSRYGKVNITKDKIAEMVKHFNENVRAHTSKIGLPIDIEHGTTQWKDAAAGWIKKLYAEDDGGWGDVEWTPLGQKLLNEKIYKLYSPEFNFEYVDPQYGYRLKNVMTGGGLVNKPMIKDDLQPIVNSEANGEQKSNLTKSQTTSTLYLEIANSPTIHSMQLSEILKKGKTERTSDEQKFIVEHQDEMTFAEAKKEGLVPAKTTAEEKPQAGMVTLSESQVKQLQEDAAAGKSAAEQLRKSNLKEEVKGIVFTEKGSKMKTDQIDKAVELLMTMSEAQATIYKEQLKSLPEPVQFEEIGSSKALNIIDNPQSQWDTLAKARAAEKKITYSEAENELGKENPELRDAAYATKTA